jgi:hypothetical protein
LYNKNDDDDTITFMLADTQASFNVGNDMWMWERSTAKLGGIMTKSEIVTESLPHTITLEDAKVLLNIFDTIALNKFKQYC